jgi:hypothetical protein
MPLIERRAQGIPMNTNDRAKPRFTVRFGLRSLLAFIVIVATLLGWWIDHRRLVNRIDLFEIQLELLQGQVRERTVSGPPATFQSRFATAAEFVSFLQIEEDWYKFDKELGPFVETSGADDAVEPLLALLDDPHPEIRWRSLCALGRLKRQSDVVLPALIQSLGDSDPNVGWHAAYALGEFGEEARDAIPALREKMMDDDSQIATFSAMILNRIDPTQDIGPRLSQLTRNKHRENRWRAVQSLSDHVDGKVAESVLTATFENADEGDPEIRKMIADALNRLRQ